MKIQWPRRALKWKGVLERYKYMLLVIGVGCVLLLFPSGSGEAAAQPETVAQAESLLSVEGLEEKLSRTLSQIQGAGETQVVLTLKSGSRQVLAQDTERGGDGDSAESTVTLGRGSGQEEVVPLQTMAPQFRGALVVCPGGADPAVRLRLIQAVSALTGLGSDCISVCPSK